jgi:hypothetical protein
MNHKPATATGPATQCAARYPAHGFARLTRPNHVHGPRWPSRPRARLSGGACPSGREEAGEEGWWSELVAGGDSDEVDDTIAVST